MRSELPLLAVLTATTLSTFAYADETSPSEKPEAASPIGTWSIDSATIGGRRFEADDWTVEISGDRIVILGSPRSARGERATLLVWYYELVPTSSDSPQGPRRFVVRANPKPDAPESFGLLELSKNELSVCFNHYSGGTAPADFEPALGRWVVSLTRQAEGPLDLDSPSESQRTTEAGPAEVTESVRLLKDFAQDVRAFGALLQRAMKTAPAQRPTPRLPVEVT